MRENRKRKFNPAFAAAVSTEPYPNFHRPTPEECRSLRDDLLSLHGFPQEFARFRRNNYSDVDANPPIISNNPDQSSNPSKLREDDEKRTALSLLGTVSLEAREESILDGLVSTLLSQNTTDSNSRRAFASLKSAFPTWEDVLAAETECVVDAIRCGGLANTKASCIKNILSSLLEKRGKLCLEYLRGMSVDAIKAELRGFKGIGPKTVACVLLFHLQQDDFPVDTHVFRIAKAIGWVPSDADREKAHLHLNNRIPDKLKFDLNCLLFTHGKICQRCAKKGGGHQRRASHDACPLSSYCCGTV